MATLGADPAAVAAHALMRRNSMPAASAVEGQPLDFLPAELSRVEAEEGGKA